MELTQGLFHLVMDTLVIMKNFGLMMYNVKEMRILFKDVIIYHLENIIVIQKENVFNYFVPADQNHQPSREHYLRMLKEYYP